MSSFIVPDKVRGMGAYKPIDSPDNFIVRNRPETGSVFFDSFTDSNGVSLPDHSPQIDINVFGDVWTINSAGFSIQSNAAQTSNFNQRSFIDVGISDLILSLYIDPPNTAGKPGVIFRSEDKAGTDFWFALWKHTSENRIEINEVVSSSAFLRASTPLVPTTPGEPYTIEVDAHQDSITATVNGTSVSFTSSSQQNSSIVGLYGRDIGDTFDSMRVNIW